MLSKVSFEQLYEMKSGYKGKLLCLDPGQTTGVAYFVDGKLEATNQLDTSTSEKAFSMLNWAFQVYPPTHVVYETYRLYANKLEQQSFSEVHTVKVCGMIDMLCQTKRIIPHRNMASQAKQFGTDDKLKAWKLWQPGFKHANDAIRHGIYYILFTHPKLEKEKPHD